MKTSFQKITFVLAGVLIGATITASPANAACGNLGKVATLHRQWWDLGISQPASLLNICDREDSVCRNVARYIHRRRKCRPFTEWHANRQRSGCISIEIKPKS